MVQSQTFLKFMEIPLVFYKTIGEELYEHRSKNKCRSLFYKIIFYLGFINFNLLVLGEIVFFVKALRSFSTVLEATAVAPCIGFSFVADFKQIALIYNKDLLRNHLDQLEALFPVISGKEQEHKFQQHERRMRHVMIAFSTLCLSYTTVFSFYPACKSFVMLYFMGAERFERNFGFLISYPYDATGNTLVYWVTYLTLAHAAYLAGVAFLAADLLLVSSVTQLCMHFNYISEKLLHFQYNAVHESMNINSLRALIRYHSKCLLLSEHVNQIFSISLLLNFLTASLTICFIGFQVTASTLEDMIMYCIFLLVSMVQVFVVCYYGDELMNASMQVGDAAYSQNWYDCSLEYKRMLVYIIARSQKSASIRPPTFPPISFNTYMKVISMSYQFFALLRTTYNNN